MRAATLVLLLIAALTVLPACQMNERMSGTMLGAVGGGIIGGAAGGAGGAVVGVLAGGVTGYLVGDYIADRRERGRSEVFESSTPAFSASRAAPATYRTGPGLRDAGRTGSVMGVKSYAAPTVGVAEARSAYERGRKALTAPEARVYFEESIRLDPSRPEPYNALALNHLYRGDLPKAEQLLRTSLEKDPSYVPARRNLERMMSGAARR